MPRALGGVLLGAVLSILILILSWACGSGPGDAISGESGPQEPRRVEGLVVEVVDEVQAITEELVEQEESLAGEEVAVVQL